MDEVGSDLSLYSADLDDEDKKSLSLSLPVTCLTKLDHLVRLSDQWEPPMLWLETVREEEVILVD